MTADNSETVPAEAVEQENPSLPELVAPVPETLIPEPAATLSEEARRTQLDLVLAGCICLAAVVFWMNRNEPVAPAPAPAPAIQPATPPPAAAAATSSAPAPVIQVSPANLLINRGTQLYQAGNFSAAEQLFRAAVKADPQSALAWCNLGAVLTSEKRYDEAIASLQRSLTLNPVLALAHNNLKWAQDEKARLGK